MGNSQQSIPPKIVQTGPDKMILQLRSRSIVIHYGYKFSLAIGDLAIFPHGLSGLKLWEANIVLARFVVINYALFKNKKVLQLGAGTGIASIAISKWTQCESIAMSDSKDQVIKNMTKNCQRNQVSDIIIFRLNLMEYQHFTNKYDAIICSEILRSSPLAIQEIYKLLKHFLTPNGSIYIVMSENIEKIQLFSTIVKSKEFQFSYEKLVDEQYYESPLLNKVEGYKQFQRLTHEDFYIIKMHRKPELQKLSKKLPKIQKQENLAANQKPISLNNQLKENSPIITLIESKEKNTAFKSNQIQQPISQSKDQKNTIAKENEFTRNQEKFQHSKQQQVSNIQIEKINQKAQQQINFNNNQAKTLNQKEEKKDVSYEIETQQVKTKKQKFQSQKETVSNLNSLALNNQQQQSPKEISQQAQNHAMLVQKKQSKIIIRMPNDSEIEEKMRHNFIISSQEKAQPFDLPDLSLESQKKVQKQVKNGQNLDEHHEYDQGNQPSIKSDNQVQNMTPSLGNELIQDHFKQNAQNSQPKQSFMIKNGQFSEQKVTPETQSQKEDIKKTDNK